MTIYTGISKKTIAKVNKITPDEQQKNVIQTDIKRQIPSLR